jgi:tetratricopeptide (TPR) repeat protein
VIRRIIFGCLALVSVAAVGTPLRAENGVTLQAIEREQDLASTTVTFRFSSLPDYEVQSGGQRVDLYLLGDVILGELGPLPEDERIIKVLLAGHRKGVLASVLFRSPPARVSVEKNARRNELVIDCLWEEPHGARPGLAMYIKGMPVPRGDGTAAVTGLTSRFSDNWEELFSYRSPLQLDIPVAVHIPKRMPLPRGPWISGMQSVWGQAGAGEWKQVAEMLEGETGVFRSGVGFLTLSASSCLQTGEYARAVQEADRVLGAGGGAALEEYALYVKALALARSGEHLQAAVVLRNRPDIVQRGGAMAPYWRLLLAELAVQHKEPDRAAALLNQGERNWPGSLLSAVTVRRGDVLAVTGREGEALQAYGRERDMVDFPSSLWRKAEILFGSGGYGRSALLYGQLKSRVVETPVQGLVQWREALALVEAGQVEDGVFLLKMVVQDFYGTEASDRARLALLDLQRQGRLESAAVLAGVSYARVANRSRYRPLRQEAMLKQALSLSMDGNDRESVRVLERFLHEFRVGSLRGEAQALLADILPGVVEALIDSGEQLPALVLVERNRDILISSRMRPGFLEKLADGFSGLTLYTRAARVLQYLLDASEPRARERLYPPLARLFVRLGQADRLERLVREYETAYPDGTSLPRLRGLWARALLLDGDAPRAARVLPAELALGDPELERVLARIHWETGELSVVAECLKDLDLAENMHGYEAELLLRGEALMSLQRYGEAQQVFEALAGEVPYRSQARFRLARIFLARGSDLEAQTLLRELAENEDAGRWSVLARELLADLRLGVLEKS